jgi:hypothetical protein
MVAWVENTVLVTSKDWQFSQTIQGDYVRITHEIYNPPDPSDPTWLPYPWYGLIAQAEYNPFTLMGVRRLYPSFNRGGQIFFFPSNLAINDRRIAIRGQTKWETNTEWHVTVWTPSIPIDATLSLEAGQQLELTPATIDAIATKVFELSSGG